MIKLISFNIKCNGEGKQSIDYRAPLLKTVLNKYDADLIGFQEATPKWMEHIERDYGEEYEIFNQYRAAHSREGTPILWRKDRFECLKKGYFWLSDTPDMESGGWDDRPHYRIVLWVQLFDKKEGTTIVYFNTHYGFGAPNQVKSSNLIMAHFAAMKADTVFLTADFNMYPKSPGYNKLCEQLIDVNMTIAKDTRNTYHGYNPEAAKEMPPIDFCFVSPETVTPVGYRRIDDLVNGEFPSDHYGVYVELELHEKLRVSTLNLDNSRIRDYRTGKLRVLQQTNDILLMQEVDPSLMEKMEKLDGFTHTAGWWDAEERDATPIFWKTDKFALISEEKLGKKSSLAVLKYKVGDRKVCAVNVHAAEGEQETLVQEILARTAEYGELPVIVGGDFGMEIGSAPYRALREVFEDARRGADKDASTLNGLGDEMTPPTICDYIFAKGCKPLDYKVKTALERKLYVSDHNCVCAAFCVD